MNIVFLSNSHLERQIFWRNLTPPLERTFAEQPDVRVVAPPGFGRATFRTDRPAWLDALRTVRSADAVFWVQLHLRPPLPLWGLAYVSPSAHRAMLMLDAWRPHLDDLARVVRTQRLSACYVLYTEALDVLRDRNPGLPFRWLPVGYNSDVFHDLDRERDIDFFWLGRRYDPLHDALETYCGERRLTYRVSRDVDDPETPAELNELIARSRYFVVTTPDLADPIRTGGFRPLTSRYLEGLAAGSRLLGVAPVDRERRHFLAPGALLECAADGSDLATVLAADEDGPDLEARRTAARDLVHARHTWADRAVELTEQLRGLVEPG